MAEREEFLVGERLDRNGVVGAAVKSGGLPPFLLTWEIVGGVLAAQVVVGLVGPAMLVVRLQRLQPEEAFRN